MPIRIGFGSDTHRLSDKRDFILGGVKIPHTMGLLGHSDADVLIHAIIDALLGAAALGDIGAHFPDTNPEYKDIDSTVLLSYTVKLISENGYTINNVDTTVTLEKPKLAAYISAIRQSLAELLLIPLGNVSVKAKTSEKLGFIGREEGVTAYAVVLLEG
ncbi:MAG: 2-C-methyl-D-erythritol 2,4-cyclodiphosphate synthase [Bacteroidota bacterium]